MGLVVPGTLPSMRATRSRHVHCHTETALSHRIASNVDGSVKKANWVVNDH
jgi:hypothetical protein